MIKISNLTKSFNHNLILKGIDLTINKGEIIAIIGASGSGKSTLLRCINLLEKPDSGTLKLNNIEYDLAATTTKEEVEIRQNIAFVFQNYSLFSNKTAIENIIQGLITVRKIRKEEATKIGLKILEEIGLEDKQNHYPSQLSGGQQQRIGIARAMVADSSAILFDEPTSALDPEWVDEVLELISNLAKKHQTMIIVTHEIDFACEIADRLIFLADGKIVEQATPHEMLTNPQDDRVKKFLRKHIKIPIEYEI